MEQWAPEPLTGEQVTPLDAWRCSTSAAESVDNIFLRHNLLLAFSKTSFAVAGQAQSSSLQERIVEVFRSLGPAGS